MSRDVVDWEDIKVGDRVEVTPSPFVIEVTEIDTASWTDRVYIAGKPVEGRDPVGLIRVGVDVCEFRRVPDPLPTEPGVRFWGQSHAVQPCWWFVQETHTPRDYVYVPPVAARPTRRAASTWTTPTAWASSASPTRR